MDHVSKLTTALRPNVGEPSPSGKSSGERFPTSTPLPATPIEDRARQLEALRAVSVAAAQTVAMSAAMSSTSAQPITARHIDRFWQRMSGTFGHKWITSYGPEPNEAWVAALKTLTVDQVKRGLDGCLTWAEEWPPTLPQFMGLCKAAKIAPEHRVMPTALPMPGELWNQRAEAARDALSGVREGMRLQDWLKDHEKRVRSPLEDELIALRGRVVAARLLGGER